MEARLNAHRQLMVHVLALLIEDYGRRGALPSWLSDDTMFRDHQEDPGAVPNAATAIGGQAADELRRILEDARTRVRATAR
jgi:hypothetical protein